MEPDHVRPCRKFAFSIGHFLNDLCASVWFSYSLVFYHRVAKFSNSSAGYLLLIGQVADAFSTTLVGFASDRTKQGGCGKRKSWHLLGVICVLCSFPFCFQLPRLNQSLIFTSSFVYYTVFIIVFQFGWACSQIGHLSMLNELTPKDDERVALNAYRHAWSIVANIFVYTVTWSLLDNTQTRENVQMNANVFQTLTYVIMITGSLTSLLFHVGSNEPPTVTKSHRALLLSSRTWRDFFHDTHFYLISLIWMLTRVISNVSQVYLPLYIMDTTDASQVDRTLIATGPLCVYVTGFVTSFPMRTVNQYLGRKVTLLVGLAAILFSSILFWCIFSLNAVFGISMQFTILLGAVLLGIGITTAQITSSAFTSDFIGSNTESSAFVYGTMSFLDKLANGVAVALIQQYNPCSTCPTCCPLFYRQVLTLIPGSVAVCTLIILASMGRWYSRAGKIDLVRPSISALWHRLVQRTLKTRTKDERLGMPSSKTAKRVCVTCHTAGDVFLCRGCRQTFCPPHVDEHREQVAKDVDKLAEEHEQLQRDMNRDNEAQLLSSIIDTWEQESIEKITQTAANARADLQQWLDRNNTEVKIPFEKITSEVRACQKAEDYTEVDLKRWIQQLEEYRSKVKKSPTIDLFDEDTTRYIHLIKLRENSDEQPQSDFFSRPSITLDQSMMSFQESTALVRERFDDVNGIAKIFEDGHVVTYGGAWLGNSSICGINHYSSGTHHIRFRVLEKFYDLPFFGIVTASQPNTEHVLESISTNGWWNFDFPIINGVKERRVGRDKLTRAMDELTLTIDCERRQIFLKHHRSGRLLHQPIDIRACPFPWKMLVVLLRRWDSIRIVGGTLNLTRGNLSSRLSHQRKA